MNYLTNIAIVARRIIFSNIVLEILVLFITNFADMYITGNIMTHIFR